MKSILLKTPIPGPKSSEWIAKRDRLLTRAVTKLTPIYIARSKGAVIEDVDGNCFLDFASGIGVTNLGHQSEPVIEAIRVQSEKFLHTSFNVAPYSILLDVAERLTQIAPGPSPKKVFFANSGAEAVENAIKIARYHTHRQSVICFEHAFHGRTYMALSLTAKVKPYRVGFAPFCPEVYRAPFPYAYRSPGVGAMVTQADLDRVSNETFARFEEMIQVQVGADQVAAIILEPVLGEGGFLPVPPSFFKRIREYCTKNGIVLIADEIQTGFGRTGKFFACEHFEVEPDLLITAKALGGGLPISAVVGKSEIMDSPDVGSLGGTFAGNPLACAAAIAVMDQFKDGKIFDNANLLANHLWERLKSWQHQYESVGDVRGLGSMVAIEFVKNKSSKEHFKEGCQKVMKYALENGVILLSSGSYGNAIRFLPPLTMTAEQLHEGLEVIERGIKAL